VHYRNCILILLLKQVHVEVVVIESDDVASAVAEEVTKYAITKLVVGASTGGLFKRYFYNDNKIILGITLTHFGY